MRNEYTTPFGIAHYILLLAVGALALGIIIYAAYWGPRSAARPTPRPSPSPVPSKCARDVANAVEQMWAYHPEFIPAKYQNMVIEYLAAPVEATVRGTCNNVKFTCRAGQIRRMCDPCAMADARDSAMEVHISDIVAAECNK